jgi:hypothetical protein
MTGGLDSPLFADRPGFLMRWTGSVYEHVRHIRANYSRFSSANNHLIGEAAGVYVACSTWPFWPETAVWRDEARTILVRELELQHTGDGVNKEQAVSYQQFVIDFYLMTLLVDRGTPYPSQAMDRFRRLFEFLASIMDCGGNVPMIGDSDDGYVTTLSQEPGFCAYRSLLATGAVLFGDPRLKHKAGRLDDKTRWLLGPGAEPSFASLSQRREGLPFRRAFPEGGYYLLGRAFEQGDEVRLLIDSGPLGYLSLAAHGHADALALTLSASGEEFLIDPGTYAYHTREPWRTSFRGTAAHNTARIDGRDQSVIGGKFMWTHKAAARCEVFDQQEGDQRFIGSHDGYMNLPDPVLHRREVRFRTGDVIECVDTFECQGQHRVELFWHFHERCAVRLEGGLIIAERDRNALVIDARDQGLNPELHKGEEALRLGWVSRRFDRIEPTCSLRLNGTISGTTSLRTVLKLVEKGGAPEGGGGMGIQDGGSSSSQ